MLLISYLILGLFGQKLYSKSSFYTTFCIFIQRDLFVKIKVKIKIFFILRIPEETFESEKIFRYIFAKKSTLLHLYDTAFTYSVTWRSIHVIAYIIFYTFLKIVMHLFFFYNPLLTISHHAINILTQNIQRRKNNVYIYGVYLIGRSPFCGCNTCKNKTNTIQGDSNSTATMWTSLIFRDRKFNLKKQNIYK